MHGLATARLSSIGRAMALRSEAWQRQGTAVQSKGYEVNCCAVALRSTDGQGEGKARQSDVLRSEGEAWRGNEPLRKGEEWHRTAKAQNRVEQLGKAVRRHGMEKQREAVARRGGERLAKLSKGTAKQGDAKRRHSMG